MAPPKKTAKRKTIQKPAKTPPPSHIIPIQSAEERAQQIAFNFRFRQIEREDLLDRL